VVLKKRRALSRPSDIHREGAAAAWGAPWDRFLGRGRFVWQVYLGLGGGESELGSGGGPFDEPRNSSSRGGARRQEEVVLLVLVCSPDLAKTRDSTSASDDATVDICFTFFWGTQAAEGVVLLGLLDL
jgi:hypothetical protein